jgi:hypothetical protein
MSFGAHAKRTPNLRSSNAKWRATLALLKPGSRGQASPLLRGGPPLSPPSLLCPSWFLPRGGLALSGWVTAGCGDRPDRYRGDRFRRFAQEPEPSSRHLHAGHHLVSKQVSPRLLPR